MSQRYYVQQNLMLQTSASLTLTGSEAHHLLQVMRKKEGESLELFDGLGNSIQAVINEVRKKEASLTLQMDSLEADTTNGRPRMILATAVPKGDRFRWLIEKATELGVDQIIPLTTSRSVVLPRETKLEKQTQYIIEACKQCGRNRLMTIAPVQTLEQLLAVSAENVLRLLGDLSGELTAADVMARLRKESLQGIVVVMGPEGGLTEAEQELLRAGGFQSLALGRYVLRTESAALAACSLLAHLLNSLP